MANKRVQINSFCGGTSKLVDDSFLGQEESINMFCETIQATDSFSNKVLKSIEGFSAFIESSTIAIKKIVLASVSPEGSAAAGKPVLIAIGASLIYRIYEDGEREIIGRLYPESGDTTVKFVNNNISVCETSGANPYLVICGRCVRINNTGEANRIFCIPLTSDLEGSKIVRPLSLPDAFDHTGKISPTTVAYLNYRIVTNDEGHDYIYWSELNKPDGVNDDKAFYQKLTRYTYTKKDGTQVTADDNQYYAPAYGTYEEDTLQTEEVWMAALNNVKADFKADNVKNIVSLDQSFIAFGSTSYQVYKWQDSLYAPFVTTSKTSFVGLRASEACSVLGNYVYFLGYGSTGSNAIWRAGENGLERISTNSVEQQIAAVSDQEKVYSFTYAYKGHEFFVISFYGEDDNFTLCYDATENEWHTRATMDENGNLNFWNIRSSAVAYGKVLFTSYEGKGLYVFDKDSFVDTNGNNIPRIRTTGIKFENFNDLIVRSLELITDNGAGKDLTVDPRVMLQVSTDGGFTWSSEKWVKSGKVGQRNFRTLWRDLGKGSRIAFKVKVTDGAPFNIASAFVEYAPLKNRLG